MKHALSHLHIRKHHAENGAPTHSRMKFLDGVALANGIFGSLTPIPQIAAMYSSKKVPRAYQC
ncbi:MAG: hypothetical protein A3I44_04200 [Candidatus Sungbacteria bacterium RIFCSPLOWO2_02_FULL_51_17]|uniref:Uncharacterized protein n=1 Tax=Candidatus Sungbacteria bacterium RIFCSPHIGHO2_02_FULL_51_29 TaxID=1802273 RepID=A0A1G2KWC0_9BACT|nr:MAG: hypothetical protein A2676_02710 [Candidatus Sungbacteria bacterium RIFCSPHIGHO2_01_FULL_51_22]OHA03700.1 MAG: hypothetical protein A3C16_03630 [Candidatus Sungbacteria bacterium RIFCSPHIGHO2_02_FULL_51_29]OHA07316.1 MAG: hypothetical protein A3B29_02805 [Candidatus Sungbacteria bacterium RIFCSPLOWO2_01_FULL_51_34]OHA11279.1 MAG: hypothetical protein A3I44_04200 [Candidatus Sungbacteria bacterium RIFCSPLOWO2_02_FULL_51_17]